MTLAADKISQSAGGLLLPFVSQTAGMLAVLALVVSVALPMFDHHFAERMPEHGHLFPAGGPAAHVHTPNDGHAHTVRQGGVPSGARAVVSKLAEDPQPATAPTTAGEIQLVYAGPGPLVAGMSAEGVARPESAGIKPPEEPPRAGR